MHDRIRFWLINCVIASCFQVKLEKPYFVANHELDSLVRYCFVSQTRRHMITYYIRQVNGVKLMVDIMFYCFHLCVCVCVCARAHSVP